MDAAEDLAFPAFPKREEEQSAGNLRISGDPADEDVLCAVVVAMEIY